MADDEEKNSSEDLKEMKRRERLEQNRISARESRKRKKTMIEELQRTVIGLSRDNKDLNDRNETLRRQLMELGTKVSDFLPPLDLLHICNHLKNILTSLYFYSTHNLFLYMQLWAAQWQDFHSQCLDRVFRMVCL